MSKSRFSEAQIITILKEVEKGRTVKEVCREHSVSEATYYQWKTKYVRRAAPDGRFCKTRTISGKRSMAAWKLLILESSAIWKMRTAS